MIEGIGCDVQLRLGLELDLNMDALLPHFLIKSFVVVRISIEITGLGIGLSEGHMEPTVLELVLLMYT